MFFNPRSRCAVRIGAAALLVLGLAAIARADLLFLKDGFVIEGKVKREYTLVVDGSDTSVRVGTEVPHGPFYLEDGPRRISFSPSQLRIVEKRDANKVERLNDVRIFAVPARPVPAVLEILAASPFNDKWERTIRFRTPRGAAEAPQHLGFLTSYWARVDAIKSVAWSACYLTREFSVDELVGILSLHPDLVERPGMAESEVVARRHRLIDFLVEAGHFSAAERELRGIATTFPDQAKAVAADLAGLNRLRGRERFEDIKRMHITGQYQLAQKMLADFATEDVAPEVLADVNDLKTDYQAAALKLAEAKRLLKALALEIYEVKTRPTLSEAAGVIGAEVQPDTLSRLDAFVSQANQYERQKAAGKTPEVGPTELLSLAVSGWLLGGASAETKPATAIRLWHARQMILAYLKTDDVGQRADLLAAFQRGHGDQRLDEILQIIPTLPPPEPETNLSTVNPIEQSAGKGGPTYLVQLPPEYRHGRSYPVLIVLHEANEKPFAMLRRWADVAAENGYILVAPSWQAGVGGYTFSAREHATVLESLRDLRRKYNVDSDRVFLFGLGQGGSMAFDVGLSHPDQFAGVSTMGASPILFAERYFRNAQQLPLYVISGSADYDSSKKLKSFFEDLNTRGYPALWFEYKGRGVEWFGGEVPNLMDWMRTKRRAFPLHQLGTDGNGSRFGNEYTTMRATDNRFYWLSTDGIDARSINNPASWNNGVSPGMLFARIDPSSNSITVIPKGVRQVTVWLGRNSRGENMIDFDKPVTIRVNFAVKWNNKPIVPSLATLLEDLYQRGDRQRLFLAKVDLSW